jgi:D-alanyl-D-alanine carboxypeptidase
MTTGPAARIYGFCQSHLPRGVPVISRPPRPSDQEKPFMPIRQARLGAGIVAAVATTLAALPAVPLYASPLSPGLPGSGVRVLSSPCTAPFNPRVQQQLRQVITLLRDDYQIPGVEVGVNVPGEGCWADASGFADLAGKAPLSLGSEFPVESITKTFTATVILQLVQEGKLSLSDPVSAWVPYIQDANIITIKNLLNMTSGIYSEPDPAFERQLQADPHMVVTPEQLIRAAVAHGPAGPPGTVSYSNTNYFVLGLIAQDVTGQTIQRLITERILRPLHLTGTSVPSRAAQLPASLVHGYEIAAGNATDVTPRYALFGPELGGAAGAMISTLGDLELWAYALGTGELLTPQLQQQRLSFPAGLAASFAPLPGTGVSAILPGRYGLGIGSFGGLLGHNGGTTGYEADMFYLPSRNATIVLLINGTPAQSNGHPESGSLSDAAAISIAEIVLGSSLPAGNPQTSRPA